MRARRTKYFAFGGGVDLVTAPLALRDGFLIGAKNYEIDSATGNGYRRIDGYECFDGNQSPTDAPYWIITFDEGTSAILANDVLGELSGAGSQTIQVVALADAVLDDGAAWDGTGTGTVVVGYDSSTGLLDADSLADNNTLYVDTTFKARINGSFTQNNATDDDTHTTNYRLAIEHSRTVISALPGSGAVRGVWSYKGTKYGFRDNAGATACVMHKATATGWSAVALGRELAFTSGSYVTGTTAPAVGDTITGATSGATAVLTAVNKSSGSWSGNDAAGYYHFASQTGTFVAEDLNIGAALNISTIAGNSSANTLPAGGRYEFVNENFYGAASARRMYGCNGVGNAFEFDGTNFHFMHTGMVTDTPNHITEHKKHLFLSFPNGSVQHSATGEPMTWTVILGAGEIGTSDEVTGFCTLPGDALGILNRNRTYILYGTSVADWNLTELSDEAGAIEWTIQRLGRPFYLDDRGVTDMQAVQSYGDFKNNTYSRLIAPLLREVKSTVVGSLRVREKNQYRLFFANNTVITFTFEGNKLAGITTGEYDHLFSCGCGVENSSGDEELFFGSDDGYVYHLDKGTSFNGGAVEHYIRPAFNHLGSPEYYKQFFKAVLEITASSAVDLYFTPDFDYSENDDITQSMAVAVSGGYWGIGVWGTFIWGGQAVDNPEIYFDGQGQNLGCLIYGNSVYDQPHTLHGINLHYQVRGLAR